MQIFGLSPEKKHKRNVYDGRLIEIASTAEGKRQVCHKESQQK